MGGVDFAFFFSRVLSFYSLGYEQLMALPIRVFWTLCDQIPRIEAYQQRLALQIATCAQSGEGATEMFGVLDKQIGEVVTGQAQVPMNVPDPEKVKKGWSRLRVLAG